LNTRIYSIHYEVSFVAFDLGGSSGGVWEDPTLCSCDGSLLLSRELTFAQGMNIAGFEFGCAITVRLRRSMFTTSG